LNLVMRSSNSTTSWLANRHLRSVTRCNLDDDLAAWHSTVMGPPSVMTRMNLLTARPSTSSIPQCGEARWAFVLTRQETAAASAKLGLQDSLSFPNRRRSGRASHGASEAK
jgi:hypothetical protein